MESMNKQNQDQHRRNQQQQQQQQQQQHHEPQKCPRCDSTNTKFCYYNNYSLSQPRYFCKTCRRYWTQGGTLRNVPVGGGCRKGKRAKTAAAASSASSASASSSFPHSAPLPPLPLVPSDSPAMAPQYGYLGTAAATGYLSSSPFAAIQTSFAQADQHELLGVSSSSSSASASSAMMSLLQGFGDISNSFGTAQPGQFYMASNSSDRESLMINQLGGPARTNNGPVSSSSHQQDHHWPAQSFNNMLSTSASQSTAVWNLGGAGAGDVRGGNTSASGPSLVPNDDQWPDLPRSYRSPPPP